MTKVRRGRNKRFPVVAGARRRRRMCKRSDSVGPVSQIIEYPLRRTRTDTGNKVHQAKAGNTIAWILNKPQQRQHVLDVSGIEKLQASKFDERDVAAGQLDFQRSAVAGCPK